MSQSATPSPTASSCTAGTNTECAYQVLYPLIGTDVSSTINVRDTTGMIQDKNFYLIWNIVDSDCVNPAVSFEYELTDMDTHHRPAEYVYVKVYYEADQIADCGITDSFCDQQKLFCFNDISISGVSIINKGQQFILKLVAAAYRYCSYSLWADVTLKCDPVPSPSPTYSPTNAPSLSPIYPPTNIPSYSPIQIPTKSPTFSPSNTPSFSPSNIPTMNPSTSPSNIPSLFPSDAPTYSPTASPTRGPTMERSMNGYNTYIPVTYMITNLTEVNIYYIVDNTLNTVDSMQGIIERNYFTPETLEYDSFWVDIEEINDKQIKNGVELTAYDFDVVYLEKPMVLTSKIECDDIDSGLIIITSGTKTFQENTQKQLQIYFNNTDLQFNVMNSDELKAVSKYTPNEPNDPTIFILSGILIGIGFICSFCVFVSNKSNKSSVDNANWKVPLLFTLQIYDLLSDINLAFEICDKALSYDGNQVNNVIFWCAVGSVATVVIPFIRNLLYTTSIPNQPVIQNNKKAKGYFAAKSGILIAFTAMSGGCYPALLLVSSCIGGYDIFSSGLTRHELNCLIKIKIRSTITMENGPQLLIQMIYVSKTSKITAAVFLAFVGSLLSIIIAVAGWYGNRLIRKESDIISYFLVFKHKDKDFELTEAQIQSIDNNIGRKGALKKEIGRELELAHSDNIDIGYINKTKCGLEVYVSHYIATNKRESVALDDNPLRFLNNKFYKQHKEGINGRFRRHFGQKMHDNNSNINDVVDVNVYKQLEEDADFSNFYVSLYVGDLYDFSTGTIRQTSYDGDNNHNTVNEEIVDGNKTDKDALQMIQLKLEKMEKKMDSVQYLLNQNELNSD